MVLLFGPFELDLSTCELRQDGRAVALQPRVFDTIRYLVENAGRLVGKQELIDALWGGEQLSSVVVPWSISHARKVLGDRRWIETVRGRGYRFMGEVRAVAVGEDTQEPFLGRDGVVKQLLAGIVRARDSQGGLYLLAGDPGIGKTRCSNEVAAMARTRGISVWTGRCVDGGFAPPLWPFLQVLRELARDAKVGSTERREAALLLSALDGGLSDKRVAPEAGRISCQDPEERFWLLDAIASCLRQSARSRVRLIVLEDLHWADQASMRALALLAPQLSSARIVLLATSRDARVAESHLGKRLLFKPDETCLLTGLALDDVERYLASTLGPGPASALRDSVHARTAGNPLFLREATRLLLAVQKKQHQVRPEDVQLPHAAKVLLSQRFGVLAVTTRAVLDAASVLGNDFTLPLLSSVVEADGGVVVRALEEAVAGQILEAKPAGAHFGFVHALLREVLYSELPLSTRMRLHARSGIALEQHGPSAALAHHFREGGDHERALRYSQAAAQEAMQALAYEEAARNYHWALEALAHQGSNDLRARCELLLRSASAISSAGDRRVGRRRVKLAIELAEQGGHADLLIQAARVLRPTLSIAAVPDETACKTLERALALLPESEVSLRAQAFSQLSCIPPYSTSITRSRATSEQALRLARQIDEPEVLLEALNARWRGLSGPDSIDALLDAASEVLRLDARSASRRRADAQVTRYLALMRRGDVAAAERALAELGATGRQLRVPEWTWQHDRLRAQCIFEAGQLDAASAEFERLWRESHRLRLPYGAMYYVAQLKALQVERTDLRHCQELANMSAQSWAWAREVPAWRSEQVLVSLEAGDHALARSEFRALAEDDFAAVTRDSACLVAFAKLAQACVALHERAAASALFEILRPYAQLVAIGDLGVSSGSVSHPLGVLAAFLGQTPQARVYFRQAMVVAARIGDELQGQRTRLALAELLSHSSASRERLQAADYAAQVVAAAERSGRTALRASAQALLDSMEVPSRSLSSSAKKR